MARLQKPNRRLSLTDAVEIWHRRRQGQFQHDIAADFGVNQGRISEILTGKKYPEAQQLALQMRQA